MNALTVFVAAAGLVACSDNEAEKMHLQNAIAIQQMSRREAALELAPECQVSSRSSPPAAILAGPLNIRFSTPIDSKSSSQVSDVGTKEILLLLDKQQAQQPSSDAAIFQASIAKPAPNSALVTPNGVSLQLSEVSLPGWYATLLVKRREGEESSIYGVLLKRKGSEKPEWAIIWFPDESVLTNLSVLEHLYAQSMTIEPDSSVRFLIGDSGLADLSKTPLSNYTTVQRQLALARQCTAAFVARDRLARPIAWQFVAIEPGPPTSAHDDKVEARLRGPEGALAGRPLIFSRPPHQECQVLSDAAGIGVCQLVDSMGHEAHAGFENAQTTVTFPGELRETRVLLPTALTIQD